jgi:tetratricopeptide (TPR) repeat protein
MILCTAVASFVLTGCAAHSGKNDKMPSSRTHQSPDESSFAAGASRAPTAQTNFAFAKILIAQGRDRDALYVLEKITREHPKFTPAYNEAAGVYVRADRMADALTTIELGLKQSPSDPVLHNNLGMCKLLKEDYDGALAAFTRAADTMPTNPTFRANRAAALALLGRDKEAEAEYRTVLGKNPTRENLEILNRARAGKDQPKTNELATPQQSHKPTDATSQIDQIDQVGLEPDFGVGDDTVVDESELVEDLDFGTSTESSGG